EAVALQDAAGLDVVSDGELRRYAFLDGLGLVTTKKPRFESVDELRRRIDEAARYVPLDRLALSPQCGFASTMEGNLISPERQREKLARVAETARLVWGHQ